LKKTTLFKVKIAAFLLILITIAGSAAMYYYYFIMPNNNFVVAFDETGINLVIEGALIEKEAKPFIANDEIMLDIKIVKKYFDPTIWWDEALGIVTVTTSDKVIRMNTDNLQAFVNNKPIELKVPVKVIDGSPFIPIEFLLDLYNINIIYNKTSNVVIIDKKDSVVRIAEPIIAAAVVRKERTVKAPIIKILSLNSEKPEEAQLRVFEDYDKWYKVRTSEGYIGYIEKKSVVVKHMYVSSIRKQQKEAVLWKPNQGKINLVWEAVYNTKIDYSKISKMEGLDVISPTWFQIENEKGQLINKGDIKYVEWAHSNGYKVWALFGNDTTNINMTNSFLYNTDARDNAIRQILAYSALLKLDGINIDFENIYKADKDALTQFIREITPLLKEQGLVVSMDIAVPDGSDTWSLCYDRKAIGEIVDYVMLMTYDQYWTTSPVSGSVAQISWVEKNLKKTLEQVPVDKILLGIPYYIRVWEEKTDKDNKLKVAGPAKVITMEVAKKLIKDNNAQPIWDENSGQYYVEYQKDASTFKMWLEDEASIDLKTSLVHKYSLAGAAAWSRAFETPDIWPLLNKNLKSFKNYQDWVTENLSRKYFYIPK